MGRFPGGVSWRRTLAAQTITAQVVWVVDGDTIHVRLGRRVEPVWYIGVNAPEVPYPTRWWAHGGSEARAVNRRLIAGRRVRLELPAGFTLRHTDPGPSSVSRDAVLRWLGGEPQGSVAQALDALHHFFTRYVVFRDERDPLLLAAWTLGTYCYRAVRVFPYLALRSAEKRYGKTRLLTLLSKLAFSSSPVTTFPTEAQLYRSATRTGGAQLFDEVETLKGDRDRLDALLAVLNVGFEQGGVVSRLEKRGEKFVEVHYEVYAPRVLAGLAGLKDTLEDRAIPIFMLRKRREEPVARLTQAVDAEAQSLRDQCALACLARIGDILTAYEAAPALLEKEAIDDRAVDLWTPLVALTLVADAESEGARGRPDSSLWPAI